MKFKLIEKDGKFFKADEKGEVQKDTEGKEVLATEDEIKAFKESQNPPFDPANATLEELAKINPNLANLLKENQDRDAKDAEEKRKREEDERQQAEKAGNFEKLYKETDVKLKEKEGEVTKLQNIVGNYKKTTEDLLADAIAQIPEEQRNLIPADYSPLKKLEYIKNNSAIFGVSLVTKKGSDVPPNDNKPPLSDEIKLQQEFDELMAKPNRTATENQIMTEKARKLKEIKQAKGT